MTRPFARVHGPAALAATLAAVLIAAPRAAPPGPAAPPHAPGDGSVAFVPDGTGVTFTASTRGGAARLAAGGVCTRSAGAAGRVVETRFRDARDAAVPRGEFELPGVVNVLRGRDPAAWVRGAPRHARLRWTALWPGVDLVCAGDAGRLRYDFVVAPGADAAAIALEVRGADDVSVDAEGRLVVAAGDARSVHAAPVAFETDGASRVGVAASFRVVHDGDVAVVGFDVARRDPSRTLVLDPTVEFLSWLGGTEGDEAHGLRVGLDGTRWIAGQTASVDFPAPGGTTSTAGDFDLFVSRISPDGALVWTTLVGGQGTEESAGVVVNPWSLEVIVGGNSTSTDYPTTDGAFQPAFGGIGPGDGSFDFGDAVVTSLSPDGASIRWSTYVGGRYGEISHDLALGPRGQVVICGRTDSANFPLVRPAMSRPGGYDDGPADAFATCFESDGDVVFSTYFGGAKPVPQSHGGSSYEAIEHFTGAAFDAKGNVWFSGWSNSDDLPVTNAVPLSGVNVKGLTVNGVRAVRPDAGSAEHDAFACKLTARGAVAFARFLGGTGEDFANDVALDVSGNVHLTGQTWCGADDGFPVTAGAFQTAPGGGSNDAWAAVLDAKGRKLRWCTFLGGTSSENSTSDGRVAVDLFGRIHLTGHTFSADFPLTADATDTTARSTEAYVTTFPPLGAGGPVFSTFLGARFTDIGNAIVMDLSGRLQVAGQTLSPDLEVTATRLQAAYGGSGDVGTGDAMIATIDLGDAAGGGGKLVAPRKLSFGKVAIGSIGIRTLALLNRSRTSAVVVRIPAAGDSAFRPALVAGDITIVIPPRRTVGVPFLFAPGAVGKTSATLDLTADGAPRTVVLTGVGR